MLNKIAIEYNPQSTYPLVSPFSPSEIYREYKLKEISSEINPVYSQVRSALYDLGLDRDNFGKETWNPFSDFISPGNRVVIKPNWVREMNPLSDDISGLVSHPSVVRAVLDYVLLALKDEGEVIIGDAPIQSADFEKLAERLKIDEVINFYNGKTGVKISVEDFRSEIKMYGPSGEVSCHKFSENKNFVNVDLAGDSFFEGVMDKFRKFRVTNYDPGRMFEYHGPGKNIYRIFKPVLEADVVINIPKLKTHRKAGITCCMKNSVGIIGTKDALVHHTRGSRKEGGDAYPYFNILKWMNERMYEMREKTENAGLQKSLTFLIGMNDGIMKRLGTNLVFEGNWYGNMTLWRMLLDINNILFYCDRNGIMKEDEQRKVFFLVDAVVGGEKDGPLKPVNKPAGLLIAGWNPVLIDLISAKLIGFDYGKITTLSKALENGFLGFNEGNIAESQVWFNGKMTGAAALEAVAHFEPSAGWKKHIEA
ncbi:MAG TPA: DUF362 domain-containing protein [Bacteroidales bacterium]|nr:DUF362 domain-containing protein [Bacteroidales bacterium]